MLEKLSISRADEWSITGAFVVVLGTFLPWYSTRYPGELPWHVGELTGLVYGYTLIFGRILLLLSGLYLFLVLYARRKDETTETFLGKLLVVSLISFIFVFNVMGSILTHPGYVYFSPHIGLIFLFVGVVSMTVGLKKNYEDF